MIANERSFGRLIAAEFQKLFSTRLWLVLLFGSVAITALFTSTSIWFGDAEGNPNPPLASAEGQQAVLATSQSATALVAVLGAIGLTTEFRHRTATATFLASPRRGWIVAAKLVAYSVVGSGFGLICFLTSLAIAVPWLSAKGIDVQAGGKTEILAGVVVAVAIFALVGVGVGALVRDQVGSVVGVLAYLYIVEPIVTQVASIDSWTRYLPGAAGNAITQVSASTQSLLTPWGGAAVLVAWGLVLAVAGTFFTVRRDVS